MATYSLTATGYVTGPVLGNKDYDIPDLSASGIQVGVQNKGSGGQQLAMQRGDQMLVKNPDGSQSWYTFDAERSTATNPVLIPVGP